jgi:hypothetical protein
MEQGGLYECRHHSFWAVNAVLIGEVGEDVGDNKGIDIEDATIDGEKERSQNVTKDGAGVVKCGVI